MDLCALPPEARRFLRAILRRDRNTAAIVLNDALERGVRAVCDGIIAPAMRAVGRLWYENQITAEDEHLSYTTAQAAFASLYPRLPWSQGGPRAIFGCVEGEHHAFGALLAADVLATEGWDAVFIGGNVALAAIPDLVDEHRPALIGLSITLPTCVAAAQAAVACARAMAPRARIIVGGAAAARLARGPDAGRPDAICGSIGEAAAVARRWL